MAMIAIFKNKCNSQKVISASLYWLKLTELARKRQEHAFRRARAHGPHSHKQRRPDAMPWGPTGAGMASLAAARV